MGTGMRVSSYKNSCQFILFSKKRALRQNLWGYESLGRQPSCRIGGLWSSWLQARMSLWSPASHRDSTSKRAGPQVILVASVLDTISALAAFSALEGEIG